MERLDKYLNGDLSKEDRQKLVMEMEPILDRRWETFREKTATDQRNWVIDHPEKATELVWYLNAYSIGLRERLNLSFDSPIS